jgi:hypothetical protein
MPAREPLGVKRARPSALRPLGGGRDGSVGYSCRDVCAGVDGGSGRRHVTGRATRLLSTCRRTVGLGAGRNVQCRRGERRPRQPARVSTSSWRPVAAVKSTSSWSLVSTGSDATCATSPPRSASSTTWASSSCRCTKRSIRSDPLGGCNAPSCRRSPSTNGNKGWNAASPGCGPKPRPAGRVGRPRSGSDGNGSAATCASPSTTTKPRCCAASSTWSSTTTCRRWRRPRR